MRSRENQVVQQMLQATAAGKISWRQVEPDLYEGTARDQVLRIEFVRLHRTDERGSDRMIASLTAFGVGIDFAVGTGGFDALCQMLASSDATWKQWKTRCDERLDGGLRMLREL